MEEHALYRGCIVAARGNVGRFSRPPVEPSRHVDECARRPAILRVESTRYPDTGKWEEEEKEKPGHNARRRS